MSYYVSIQSLRRWLDKAQIALVSKNKVRKDLWTDFGEIVYFEDDEDFVPISSSEFTTIQSFLQNEGRSDNISNDSMLNWITMLHDLRRKLVKEVKVRSAHVSLVSSPITKDDKENKHDLQVHIE